MDDSWGASHCLLGNGTRSKGAGQLERSCGGRLRNTCVVVGLDRWGARPTRHRPGRGEQRWRCGFRSVDSRLCSACRRCNSDHSKPASTTKCAATTILSATAAGADPSHDLHPRGQGARSAATSCSLGAADRGEGDHDPDEKHVVGQVGLSHWSGLGGREHYSGSYETCRRANSDCCHRGVAGHLVLLRSRIQAYLRASRQAVSWSELRRRPDRTCVTFSWTKNSKYSCYKDGERPYDGV